MSITREQLLEIVTAMCEDYCRYPREWDEDQEGETLSDAVCDHCPLNKLGFVDVEEDADE